MEISFAMHPDMESHFRSYFTIFIGALYNKYMLADLFKSHCIEQQLKNALNHSQSALQKQVSVHSFCLRIQKIMMAEKPRTTRIINKDKEIDLVMVISIDVTIKIFTHQLCRPHIQNTKPCNYPRQRD